MNPETLRAIIAETETDRIEKKESLADKDEVYEAICAFANDFPGYGKPGYVIIGVRRDSTICGITDPDREQTVLASMRSDSNITPPPSMVVEAIKLGGQTVVVGTVHPSDSPPVRYKGRVCIRVGPRRAYTTAEDDRRLIERSVHGAKPFDRKPCKGAKVEDLLTAVIRDEYLPRLVAREVLDENRRSSEEWLASLRFFDPGEQIPTHAGVLLFGREPLQFVPGAYVQFVRFAGPARADQVVQEKQFAGNVITQLRQLDEILPVHIQETRVAGKGLQHEPRAAYPFPALRELVVNAIMHRAYEGTNAPVQIYWHPDRVEIYNPGGLYGHVTPETFKHVADCRNPTIAEALKVLGYVERFGVGISRAERALQENGNPPPEFEFQPTHFLVTVRARP